MNKYIYIYIFLLLACSSLQAKLLDKIVAVYNDEVITKSEIQRIQSNLNARKMIAPIIYKNKSYSQKDFINVSIHSKLIRNKLAEMHIVVDDDNVENNIKQTESRLKLSRSALLDYLKNNNLTFDEYFELTREALEYQYFQQRVILPLISITDQEIKNEFYKRNKNNKTLSFKYTLVDFSLSQKKMKRKMVKSFRKELLVFQSTGNIAKAYKDFSTNLIENISEDGLTPDIKKTLKHVDEGKFSNPVLLNNAYHVFFIKKKDLVESEFFLENKMEIKTELFHKASSQITDLWFDREKNKHYIKLF